MTLYKTAQVLRVNREKVREALLKTHPEHCEDLIQWCFEGKGAGTYRRVQTQLERAKFWNKSLYIPGPVIREILDGAVI